MENFQKWRRDQKKKQEVISNIDWELLMQDCHPKPSPRWIDKISKIKNKIKSQ